MRLARTRWISPALVLMIMLLLIAACGGATPATDTSGSAPAEASTAAGEASMAASEAAPDASEAASEAGAASTAASTAGTASTAASTAGAASTAASTAAGGQAAAPMSTNPEDYGLQPGKPFEGTKIRFLICCETVGQFVALTKRTADFTAMTGIEVEWDAGPYGPFQEKLLTEATTGTGTYDVVAWVDSWGEGIKPYLEPLDERIAADGIDMTDYPPAYVTAGSGSDGVVYGLPFRGHAQVMFYRKDVFEDLGLEPPTTWAEVAETAQKVADETDLNPLSMYYNVSAGQNLFVWLNLLWGSGGDIFDAEMRPIFNNEAGVAATEQYAAFIKNGLTNPAALTFGEAEATTDMVQGKAAMFVAWSWIYEQFGNPEIAAPEVLNNIGVIPAPTNGGDPVSYGYIWPAGILGSSQNKDAAWEFLKWMTSVPVEKAVALDKSDPATNNIVVVHLSNLRDAEINASSGGLHEVMATMLETARTEPLIAEWPEVQSVLEVALNEIAGGADAKTTLDDAQQQVDEIMKRGGYYQ